MSASTTRSPARPSHPSGRTGLDRRRAARTPDGISDGDRTITLVPSRTVTGRSVVVRTVKHGTPNTVVSSCSPPESVITACAASTSASISR